MNEIMKWLAIALCLLILAGQLWRAKRTNMHNTVGRYHCLAGMLTLAVSCELFVLISGVDPVYWTEVLVLAAALATQLITIPDWLHDVPDRYKTDPAELNES